MLPNIKGNKNTNLSLFLIELSNRKQTKLTQVCKMLILTINR